MTLTIADTWLDYLADGSTRPVADATVYLVPSQWPVYLKAGAGVPSGSQLLSSRRPGASTDSAGKWSLSCPWPSETPLNPGLQWQLVLPDHTVYQGTSPEGIAGPLSLGQLIGAPYSWLEVAAGNAVTTANVTYQPDTALIQGQAMFPGFLGRPETIVTTVAAAGFTVTYTRMGLTVAVTFNADGSITEVFGPPINRTRTTTFSGASITEAST